MPKARRRTRQNVWEGRVFTSPSSWGALSLWNFRKEWKKSLSIRRVERFSKGNLRKFSSTDCCCAPVECDTGRQFQVSEQAKAFLGHPPALPSSDYPARQDLWSIFQEPPDGGFQLGQVDRFRQVSIESRALGTLDVLLHPETGQRDGWRLPGFSYLLNKINAGAIGKTEIANEKIELLALDGLQRRSQHLKQSRSQSRDSLTNATKRARCQSDPRSAAAAPSHAT